MMMKQQGDENKLQPLHDVAKIQPCNIENKLQPILDVIKTLAVDNESIVKPEDNFKAMKSLLRSRKAHRTMRSRSSHKTIRAKCKPSFHHEGSRLRKQLWWHV